MNTKKTPLLSRRQFAHRAAVLSATASLVSAEALLPPSAAPSSQSSPNSPQLSPASQLEIDSRYQQILSLYGDRLNDAQKANIRKMCADLQPALERIRKFTLDNGNAPALYLKPLVERDKRPPSSLAPKKS